MLKFDRPTLVTITAPTASGKNYLRDAIEEKFGWTRIVSTTTRDMRAGEVEGQDYNFITPAMSREMEKRGLFAELIEFRGTRYGVTKIEMSTKLTAPTAPMVILEPKGLEIYRKLCAENSWDIFTIYIHTPEATRLERLVLRSIVDIQNVATDLANMLLAEERSSPPNSTMNFSLPTTQFESILRTHTDRVLSIVGEERSWGQTNIWDAIVPGDDGEKALDMIEQGVASKNRKNRTPQPYDHYAVN